MDESTGLYNINTRVIFLIVGSLLYVIGVGGNSLIIWTLFRIKRLRIVQNVFVVMLAGVDLLIIGYLLPQAMLSLISNQEPFSKGFCIFNAIFGHLLFTTCLQLIMCIAICRYVRICHSAMFDRIYTHRNALAICGICFGYWLLSVFPTFALTNPFIFEEQMHLCIFNRFENKIYTYMYIVFCLLLPVSVASFCYTNIYIYVRTAKLKLYRKWNNGLARQRVMHELTVTRTQFAIFVAYLIFYVPFGISTIIDSRSNSFSWINTMGIYMGFANSCINSLLYGVMNSNIRKAYSEAIPCIHHRKQIQVCATPLNLSINGHISSLQTSYV